jgi:hypothetical protein
MQQNYVPDYAMWSRARGRRANLTGDLALVEYGLGGEIGESSRSRASSRSRTATVSDL